VEEEIAHHANSHIDHSWWRQSFYGRDAPPQRRCMQQSANKPCKDMLLKLELPCSITYIIVLITVCIFPHTLDHLRHNVLCLMVAGCDGCNVDAERWQQHWRHIVNVLAVTGIFSFTALVIKLVGTARQKFSPLALLSEAGTITG
jgi:hypothetical protein